MMRLAQKSTFIILLSHILSMQYLTPQEVTSTSSAESKSEVAIADKQLLDSDLIIRFEPQKDFAIGLPQANHSRIEWICEEDKRSSVSTGNHASRVRIFKDNELKRVAIQTTTERNMVVVTMWPPPSLSSNKFIRKIGRIKKMMKSIGFQKVIIQLRCGSGVKIYDK